MSIFATGSATGTAAAGAVTIANLWAKVTTAALTTAAAANYTLTVTNVKVSAADMAFASVAFGDNTNGTPAIVSVTCAAGSLAIVVTNSHTSAAFNGTLVISYGVFGA